MPASSAAPTTPTKTGWHLVTYQNGDVGVVQWNGSHWNWTGGLNAPASPVTGIEYLGSSPLNVARYFPGLPQAVVSTLITSVDHGYLSHGKPLLVDNTGATVTGGTASTPLGPTSQQGSEAVGGGLSASVSSPLQAISAIWQWLTTPAHWLRILEYVAGAVLIFIAVDKLIGGPSVSTVVKEAAR